MFLNPPGRKSAQLRPAYVRNYSFLMPLLVCVSLCLSQALCRADDDGLLGSLAKPKDGRSMRASSTFREGADGKYDSKAFPKGDTEEKSNFDNFQVDPGKTHVLMDVKGPGVIDWIKKDRLPKDTPYFYAQYRQEYPAQKGKDYLILDTKGKGHYVGTVLAVRTRSPMWFGEGDEKIYIDGEEHASIWGTGTEDYFLSAWGLKKTLTPYAGVPYFDQWGIVGGHTSAYRWHLNDPIVFQKGIKVTIEHQGWISPDENPQHQTTSWNEREDDYASVAFWYQTGEPTFTERAPEGRERTLPSLERITVFARDFKSTVAHGPGAIETQQLDLYDVPQLLYMPQKQEDSWIEIPFEVVKKEPLLKPSES